MNNKTRKEGSNRRKNKKNEDDNQKRMPVSNSYLLNLRFEQSIMI